MGRKGGGGGPIPWYTDNLQNPIKGHAHFFQVWEISAVNLNILSYIKIYKNN